jgi:hypothetical protein
LRGEEEKSVLIAVRDQAGCAIQMLNCEIYDAGKMKRRASTNNRERGQSYSRCIIAKITLPHKVGFLGREHVAMVVHMHNELANLVLKQQRLNKFWNWLSKRIKTFNVQVLMGDFNMSLFMVIPELRSRGVKIDLGAWYPWKSLEGEPMTDSCGIFFVNLPGVYTLSKNLDHLHDRDATGILARGVDLTEDFEDGGEEAAAVNSAVAETGEDSGESEDDAPKPFGGFDRIDDNQGPGKSLPTYLPKKDSLLDKMRPSLTPSKESAAVAAPNKDRKNDGIKFKEKRLSAKIWRYKGEHQRGSHFPICVFTNNVGRRSPEKLEERRQKQMRRSWRGPQWWAQGSQEGCRARTQDADLQQGWQSRPRGDFRDSPSGQHPVVEVWPRGRLDRWKEQAQSDRRTGRRGARPLCSQASGEGWIPVLREEPEPWSAWSSTVTAAVAAAGPIGGFTPWWPPGGLTASDPSPGECLRWAAAGVVDAPRYVELAD